MESEKGVPGMYRLFRNLLEAFGYSLLAATILLFLILALLTVKTNNSTYWSKEIKWYIDRSFGLISISSQYGFVCCCERLNCCHVNVIVQTVDIDNWRVHHGRKKSQRTSKLRGRKLHGSVFCILFGSHILMPLAENNWF